mmetsp:Transcript_15499/g.37505  ORF Transcript_15499/g.37505 Transcript_15499/m.37505 type:complete len:215 (+) Transcript_15499:1939-2583(+)
MVARSGSVGRRRGRKPLPSPSSTRRCPRERAPGVGDHSSSPAAVSTVPTASTASTGIATATAAHLQLVVGILLAPVRDPIGREHAGVNDPAADVPDSDVEPPVQHLAPHHARHGLGYDLRHRVDDHARGAAEQQHVAGRQAHRVVLLIFKGTLVSKVRGESNREADDWRGAVGARQLRILGVSVPLELRPLLVKVHEGSGGFHPRDVARVRGLR